MNSVYSVYPPFSMITRRRQEITWSHVARVVSLSIFAQDSFNFFFNFSTFECDTAQFFLSKMDHIPKSIGLRSGKEGGQSSYDQKELKIVLAPGLNHFGVLAVAPSCCSVTA